MSHVNWDTLITTLGGTAILVAALTWLSKQLMTALLSKDLERFKSELKTRSDLAIEEFKSRVQLEAQKEIIEYSALHSRRAESVAQLYAHLVGLHNSIQRSNMELRRRHFREEVHRSSPAAAHKPWELTPGIDTLDPDEEKQLQELKQMTREFFEFYGKNKIYFPPDICEQIDRLATVSGGLSMNYENVAIKGPTGELLVNPKVKDLWDAAVAIIPQLVVSLEQEFRALLGVKPREP